MRSSEIAKTGNGQRGIHDFSEYESIFLSPGKNGSAEMDQSFIYSPAGLGPGGGKMGPGFGPDRAGWAESARGKKRGSARKGPKNDPKSKKAVTFISKAAHF